MRFFKDCFEMVREVERDLWEMGIEVHPQSMQDKRVGHDEGYKTKEVRAYGFSILPPQPAKDRMVEYLWPKSTVLEYCQLEHKDRISRLQLNPGNSYKVRDQIWSEFLHHGTFAYTYSERISPQLDRIIEELKKNPDTRQAIIEIHNNLQYDLDSLGGVARVPCSMHYQLMVREGALDLIYIMRSCDFLTHFPVDIWLAIELQHYIAQELSLKPGIFSYFTGSLHAYHKDMRERGIF